MNICFIYLFIIYLHNYIVIPIVLHFPLQISAITQVAWHDLVEKMRHRTGGLAGHVS